MYRIIFMCVAVSLALTASAQMSWPERDIPLEQKMLGHWLHVEEGVAQHWHFSERYGEVYYWAFTRLPTGGLDFAPTDIPSRSFSYVITKLDTHLDEVTVLVDGSEEESYSMGILKRAMIRRDAEGNEISLFFIPEEEVRSALSGVPVVMRGRFPSEVKVQEWSSNMELRQKIRGHWHEVYLGSVLEDVGGEWFIGENTIYMDGRHRPCSYRVLRVDEKSQEVTVRMSCDNGDHVVEPLWVFRLARDSRAMMQRQRIKSLMFDIEIGADLFYLDSLETRSAD